jgi:integrase
MTRSNVSKMIEVAGERAGLSFAHPHMLRHTCGHLLANVDVGTLTAAPSHGGIHLNATWVRTNAAPKPNVELSARRIAIGVSP